MKNIIQVILILLVALFNINAQDSAGSEQTNNYDYLIITPDVFMQNATWNGDLLNLQSSRGFHPVIELITVNTTAQQIKNIIGNYYNNNPLKYVMLIGNAKNLTPTDKPDTSVPYMYREHGLINNAVDYLNGTYIPFCSIYSANPWNPNGGLYIATDDPYVSDLISHGSVYIGRAPVTSIVEATNYVDKLTTYYQSLDIYSDAMDRLILLNLDVTWSSATRSITGDLVAYINNKLINEHIPASASIVELNVSEHTQGCEPFEYCSDREQLFESSLNQGASVISILGTIAGPRNLGGWYWDISSFNDVANKNTVMPFLIAPNCHQGEVNNPDFESVMRKLMVYENGGIIGAIAHTEGTEQHANGYILNRFYDLIFQDESIPYGQIFKILKDELASSSNYSWLEFFINGLTYFGDPSLVPSVYKHRAGNIASTTTWNGNFIIDNHLVIDYDATLNLTPGSNLFLAEGIGLRINGTFNANSNKFALAGIGSNLWGMLDFRGQLAAGSVLNSCNILNSNGIQINTGADVTIENCYIKNSNQGIYLYNSQPRIINNSIEDPQHNGIYGDASGLSPLIQGNKIRKITNMYSNQGIMMANNTNARLIGNDINGFLWGVYLGGGSYTETMLSNGYSPYPNNRIINNRYGITTAWGSSTIAGWDDCTGSFNSFYGNTTYDAYCYQSSWFVGFNDYWGYNPQWYADGTSFLEIENMLSEDPWYGRQQKGVKPSPTAKFNEDGMPQNDKGEISIFNGIILERKGEINKAIKFYKDLIHEDIYVDFALAKLLDIKNKYSRPELKGYFQSISNSNNKHKAKLKKIIADIHLQDNQFGNAIANYNFAISSSNGYDGINARFAKLFAYLNINNDIDSALQVLNELRSMSLTDDEFLMRMEIAEYLIENTNNRINKNIKSIESAAPETYYLSQNFPNPFNPSTIIKYQILENGFVTLKVYDILGKEVKTLVNEYKTKGRYAAIFDDSNLASGVYIYQIRVNDFSTNKKMMLIK